MSKTFQRITTFIIIILAFFTILFTGMGIYEMIDSMRVYTVSEDSLVYALEDGHYGELVADYHRNIVSDVEATETMEECYAVARYYEAAIDYKLAIQENDEELRQKSEEIMKASEKEMGQFSYAKDEIDKILGL